MTKEYELELLTKIEQASELIRQISDNCPHANDYALDYTSSQMWNTLHMIRSKCLEFLKDKK